MPSFRKSILSQFLRTKCDKQLKLSMYQPRELEALNWPVPLRARPAVQILRDRGVEWEQAKFGDLEAAFPQNLIARKLGGKYQDLDLAATLRVGLIAPNLLVQPSYGHARLREMFLQAIGVPTVAVANIPEFGTFRPDILLVQPACSATEEVSVSGCLVSIIAGDTRQGLMICDIKHAGEANSSYSAEVVLYAVLLANWLRLEGLAGQYFVSMRMGLWTRAKETSSVTRLIAASPGASLMDRIAAFMQDIEIVDFETFFQTVDHFFKEDLPRVVGTTDWRTLDWHVDSRCSNCDFLGYVPWLNVKDRARVAANRDYYCVSAAEDSEHLSRLPTLTRGGRKTLEQAGHRNLTAVCGLAVTAPVFEQHNALRADRVHLSHRATALCTDATSLSAGTTTVDFPKYADLEIFVTVNFDPGTGLLTALGSEARFRQRVPFGQTSTIQRTWPVTAHVLLNSTFEDERNALISFLSRLAEVFAFVADTADDRGGALAARTRCQLYFWDQRQFEELTRAVGRHLNTIVEPGNDRYLRGLVWLFPPDQILENEELVLANPVSLMKGVVKRDVRLPVPHCLTIFNVAEAYHDVNFTPRLPGSFYRDPFSDMIPRERVYEIWSQEPLVQIGTTQRTRAECITEYSNAVGMQVAALRSIVWKFRGDMRGRLHFDARPIAVSLPFNFQRMSEDGRLWYAWAKLEEACRTLEIRRAWSAEPEELESSYDILRLVQQTSSNGRDLTYEVAPACRDCKFREGESFLALRVESIPGFLDLNVSEVSQRTAGLVENRHLKRKMAEIFSAELVAFDRERLIATLRMEDFGDSAAVRDALITRGFVDVQANVSVVPRDGISFAKRISECLVTIARPAIAAAAPRTYTTLGHAPGTNAPRRDPVSPAASVLWDGAAVAVQDTGISAANIDAGITAIRAQWPVNDSQADAIRHCLSHRLSIIWGPPGTGKTTTAAGYVAARLLAARAMNRSVRILITGPTYTAWEKLFGEATQLLRRLGVIGVGCFRVYPVSRVEREPVPADAVAVTDVEANNADQNFMQLCASMAAATDTLLVGAVAHQCYRIADLASDSAMTQLFDIGVIDESSQLDVGKALFPLCLLEEPFELMLFGDHLQMPPVVQTKAPRDAEWLVGSIQAYLLRRHTLTPQPLLVNYRSSQPFIDFSHRIGYPPGLSAHSPQLRLQLLAPIRAEPQNWTGTSPWFGGLADIIDPAKALTAVTYQDGRAGQANDFEADLAAAIIQQIFSNISSRLRCERDQAGVDVPVTDAALYAGGILGPRHRHCHSSPGTTRRHRAPVASNISHARPDTNRRVRGHSGKVSGRATRHDSHLIRSRRSRSHRSGGRIPIETRAHQRRDLPRSREMHPADFGRPRLPSASRARHDCDCQGGEMLRLHFLPAAFASPRSAGGGRRPGNRGAGLGVPRDFEIKLFNGRRLHSFTHLFGLAVAKFCRMCPQNGFHSPTMARAAQRIEHDFACITLTGGNGPKAYIHATVIHEQNADTVPNARER